MHRVIVRAARRRVVDRSTSVGVDIRCQLLLLARWLLPNRVHGLVQDEWQGETRSRVELCSRSAPPCAQCCATMHIGYAGLSIPAATRVCTRSANIHTTAVS